MVCLMAEIGWVIYDEAGLGANQCREWSRLNGFEEDQIFVFNNFVGRMSQHESAGDNAAYEFSGYALALDKMQGQGPFVLINDTLFRHHWKPGWAYLLRGLLNDPWLWSTSGRIVGDLRSESFEFPEKPATYWASWIFVMSDRIALQRMRTALERVIREDWSKPSQAYVDYLDQWLNKSWWQGGWQGNPSPAALQRKTLSIRREHELSRILLNEQALTPYAVGHHQKFLYRVTRLIDRMLARYAAIRRNLHG